MLNYIMKWDDYDYLTQTASRRSMEMRDWDWFASSLEINAYQFQTFSDGYEHDLLLYKVEIWNSGEHVGTLWLDLYTETHDAWAEPEEEYQINLEGLIEHRKDEIGKLLRMYERHDHTGWHFIDKGYIFSNSGSGTVADTRVIDSDGNIEIEKESS